MSQSIIRSDIVNQVAAESTFTASELKDGIQKLQDALEPRINYHYQKNCLEGGRDRLILKSDYSYWFAFVIHDIAREFEKSDMEMESDLLRTVALTHLEDFQDKGFTVSFSRQVANSLTEPFYYPIRVTFPEGWRKGKHNVKQRFQELVFHNEMTPAEALDFWMVDDMDEMPADWANQRRVDPEAVRKNVRQAREKIKDSELSATYEVNDIRAQEVEQIPEGEPYDEDAERFYVPTAESLPDDDIPDELNPDS